MSPTSKAAPAWSGLPIETVIDRELGRNQEIRSGTAAYAELLTAYRRTHNRTRLLEGILSLAAHEYRRSGASNAEFTTFDDGAANFLYDHTRDRVALVWGVSATVAPGTRDKAYHDAFPRAGDLDDKGHAWSHAQGGREGGPNYFRQARRLNQARSTNGRLWRAIEQHLAANAGLRAFVRLMYDRGNASDRPDRVEYGILPASGQFRAVIFPNS